MYKYVCKYVYNHICLNMLEYVWICLNMFEYVYMLFFTSQGPRVPFRPGASYFTLPISLTTASISCKIPDKGGTGNSGSFGEPEQEYGKKTMEKLQ